MEKTLSAFVGSVFIALSACSDNNGSTQSRPLDDGENAGEAEHYSASLQKALDTARAGYFDEFIKAPENANQLFEQPLPQADDYFGPAAFPTGSVLMSCDSGSVTRDVTLSDAQLLLIEARFDFSDCILDGKLYKGQTVLSLNGDAPSRLGGQVGTVTMQFNAMNIESGNLMERKQSLDGSFSNRSSWAMAFIGYTHEYTTRIYSQIDGGAETTVADAYYRQQLESDYYPDDDRYYRLSELGALTLTNLGQLTSGYTIDIEPALVYSSKLDAQNRPVYDDDILSGKVSYISTSGQTVGVTAAETDASLAKYAVFDGIHSFSEIDEWLYPVDCDDNSAFNRRNICDGRR